MKIKILLFISLTFSFNSFIWANEIPISGYFGCSRSTNLVDYKDGSRFDGLDSFYGLRYGLNSDYALGLSSAFSKNLNSLESELSFSDVQLNLSKNAVALGDFLTWNQSLSWTVPTSKDSLQNRSLQSALGMNVNFNLNPKYLFKNLNLSAFVSVNRNFHKYETSLTGQMNNAYSLGKGVNLSYDIMPKLNFTSSFSLRNNWSYYNNRQDYFGINEEINFQIIPHWSMALGHSNNGETLKPDGVNSNIQIMDPNSSMVYTSSTLNF